LRFLVLLLMILSLILFSSQEVSGQISLGIPAEQDVQIQINDDNSVHVTHLVFKNSQIQTVPLLRGIEGTAENLQVSGEDGNDVDYAKGGFGVLGEINIFPAGQNVVIEYDLIDLFILKENVWAAENFYFPKEILFLFPEELDLVFVNERPINLGLLDAKGFRCHGCSMTLEYIVNEPVIFQDVIWEDKKFTVEIRTSAEISSFNFEQQTKTISFDVNDENQFVTLKIPLELLWNPYRVYSDEEGKQILNHELIVEEGFVQLNIRPDTTGTIRIVGTTVIPEFPLFMPLLIGIIMVIAIHSKKNFSLH